MTQKDNPVVPVFQSAPRPAHVAVKPRRTVKPVPPAGAGTRNPARGRTHSHALRSVQEPPSKA